MFKYIVVCFLLIAESPYLYAQKSTTASDSIVKCYTKSSASEVSSFYLFIKKSANDLLPCSVELMRNISDIVSIVRVIDAREHCKNIYKESSLIPANNFWKLSASLEQKVTASKILKNQTKVFIVVSTNIEKMLGRWQEIDRSLIVKNQHPSSHAAVIVCKETVLFDKLLQDPELIFADEYIKPTSEVELIGYDRSQNEIQRIQELLPGANGTGITIGIKETNLQEADIDLQKRVKFSALADINKDIHATVIAGLAGGAGNSFITGKGIAWGCSFYSSTFNNLFPDNSGTLASNNVSVQNHSYGTINQNFYGAEAAAYDAQIYNEANSQLHIFSSGNKGVNQAEGGLYNGISGFSNFTGNFKQAKNIITVGATDTSNNLVSFSSAGPLYDGRIAPQICALGPNGTSDAAAIVSGGAAVLQQIYKDSTNQQIPAAALVKALLFTTATDIGQPGIDFKTGFGALNCYKAAKALQGKQYFSGIIGNNEVWTKSLQLPANAVNIKYTLVWTDTAALVNNNRALVNDLDFAVNETVSGTNYLPWVLSSFPNVDSLNKPAVRRRDSLNTAEQITIPPNSSNNFIVSVKGFRVQTAIKQPFYIAYAYDTLNSFSFTNPLNASDVNRDESVFVKIKWDAVTASTNATGDLFVSYDGGISWQQLASQILLNSKSFNWLLPNTSTIALLKMNCTFGSFLSPAFIIAPVTKIKIGFYCTDSIQLYWNKHKYASGYRVFSLTDSAYLKQISVAADTLISLPISNTNNIYAVQPILSNGLYATRSAAVDAAKQGVLCYYNSFLGVDEGSQIKLLLTISLPDKTDSIVIEKITAAGILIRRLAAFNVMGVQSDYAATDNAPSKGSNYYRAVVYIKNKGGYKTEKVLVISNANEPVFIYPNPVKKGQSISFQLNDFSVGYSLVIFDAKGSTIKTLAIGQVARISTEGFSPGVYMYLINKKDGTKFATGKLIIN